MAVVGARRPLGQAAALAGFDPATTARAADEIVAAGLLAPGGDTSFAHPLVAAAIEDTLDAPDREAMHARAAGAAAAAGDTERAAAHLLATPGTGDEGAVRALREAAAAASARGAADAAATLLRRALAEPPPQPDHAQVLLETGLAETFVADSRAVGRLAEAAAVHPDPSRPPAREMVRGHSLTFAGRWDEAFDAMAVALSAAGDAPQDLVDLSRLERLFAMLTSRVAGPAARRELAGLAPPTGERERALALGLRSLMDATAGEPAAATAALAHEALAAAPPLPFTTPVQLCPALALLYTDDSDGAEYWLTAVRDAARATGHLRAIQFTARGWPGPCSAPGGLATPRRRRSTRRPATNPRRRCAAWCSPPRWRRRPSTAAPSPTPPPMPTSRSS